MEITGLDNYINERVYKSNGKIEEKSSKPTLDNSKSTCGNNCPFCPRKIKKE